MSSAFSTLFSPIRLRNVNLRNRIVFGAHTPNMSEEGLPGRRHLGYYRERARGGAAMIVVEPMPAHPTGILTRGNFICDSDDVIPHFRKITDAVHDEGAAICQQIYHIGGHGDQDNSWNPYWSPSGLVSFHDPWGSHAMSENQIEEVIDGFVQAARRMAAAGFDGCDLFAGYNGLIDQFWSPITNRRDDKWGGSLENRVRFVREVIERIRALNGDDFIIGLTVTGAEPHAGAMALDDKLDIAAWLDGRGLVDYFSVGTGSYLTEFSKIIPSFQFDMNLGVPDAKAYRNVLKHALVTAESRVKTPENAEQALADGVCDLTSLVRAQIADPHLANKAFEGRADDIRPCISCNQLCIGRRMRDYWLSCLVNPGAGREWEWQGDTGAATDAPRHILVVGGGPGGLETARVAAQRGHRVTLVERHFELGGQFRLAAGQPERGEIGGLINWYVQQLEKLQVQVRLKTDLSADDIAKLDVDAVVLCTGSLPSRGGYMRAFPARDGLPGADQDNVCTAHDVLDGTVLPGSNVLLLDDINGWWPASGTALHLAEQRHMVTLVTAADAPCGQLEYSATADTTRQRFWKLGVETVVSTGLKSWVGNTATLVNLYTGDEEERDFDTLVLACTNTPENHLSADLAGSGIEVHTLGDAIAARTASMAIYEARKLAQTL